MNDLSGPSLAPRNGGAAEQLIILFHGLGADGSDLIGLAPFFATALPGAEFLAPNGPDLCDMAPPGFQTSYQWFSLQDWSPKKILDGLNAVAPQVNKFIDDELAKRGLHEHNLALIGFSQGAMLALHVALRRPQPIAAVVGFSGALAGADQLVHDIKSRPRTLLIHGEQDDVVPFSSMEHARGVLDALSVNVKTVSRPHCGHSIDEAGLEKAVGFVQAAFLMFD